MIHTLGIILVAFGCVFAFAGFLALAFGYHNSDDCEPAGARWVDAFLFCGLISFLAGFIKGVNAVLHRRPDSHFAALMVFVTGLVTLGAGWFLI